MRMVVKKILLVLRGKVLLRRAAFVLLFVSGALINGCQQAPVTPAVQVQPSEPLMLSLTPAAAFNSDTRVYPSEGGGIVKLEKIIPRQVQTGAEFEYKIKVTNLANCSLADIVVTDALNGNFQYKSSNPPASMQGNNLVWVFSSLGPKETKEITVNAIAVAGGTIQSCADITYRMPLCLQTVSIQPIIVVTMTAPAEVSLCELINCTIKVENTGTGPANKAKVVDDLPAGLVTAQGNSRVEIPIGVLSAGTARNFSVPVRAQNSGTYTTSAAALADGINVQSPPVTTVVKQPVLDIKKTGPDVQYTGNEITYDIAVTNIGDWPAFSALIEDEIPAGVSSVKVSQGGTVIGSKAMWKVVKLNPGAAARMSVAYVPKNVGTITNTAKAWAICADTVTAALKTEIRGTSGLLLEVADLADAIRIGNTVTYRIVVTNQGSAAATNIAVKSILEPQMEYVSSVGATNGSLAGDTVTFAPLPSLAPGTRAMWEITVKAKAVGDIRFKTTMSADQLDREVMETESTHFYE